MCNPTRTALNIDGSSLHAAVPVELRLAKPWSDDTTHWVMNPLEFTQRLAAPVPRHPGPRTDPNGWGGRIRPMDGRDHRSYLDFDGDVPGASAIQPPDRVAP